MNRFIAAEFKRLLALGAKEDRAVREAGGGIYPEQMYQKLCALRGEHVDRCVLYVFRGAVYNAINTPAAGD